MDDNSKTPTLAEQLAARAASVAPTLSRLQTVAAGSTNATTPIYRTYEYAPAEPLSTEEQMLMATVVAAEVAALHRLQPNANAVKNSRVVPGTDPARKICPAAFKGMIGGVKVTLDVFESKSNTPKIVCNGFELPAEKLAEGWYESKNSGN